MNKGLSLFGGIIAIVLVVALMIGGYFISTGNNLVNKYEEVNLQKSQIEVSLQKRADLIPNLVSTVKGYASHESEVFTNIADARSKAGGVVQMSDELLEDEAAFKRFQQAQDELGSALQRLLVVTENYPELKADQNFLALQDELEGTENRIATERKRYNDVVSNYNSTIRKFPKVFLANIFGFRPKAYFSATSEAQTAPKVEF